MIKMKNKIKTLILYLLYNGRHTISALSEDAEQIGTTFAAETNRRDEDADM